GGLMAAVVRARGGMADRRDLDLAPPARRTATAAAPPPEPELGGPGPARGPARRDTESAPPWAAAAGHRGHDPAPAPPHCPPPLRTGLTWSQFLRSQAETILACDFFTADLLDGTQAHVLAVIEHAVRRIRILGVTCIQPGTDRPAGPQPDHGSRRTGGSGSS